MQSSFVPNMNRDKPPDLGKMWFQEIPVNKKINKLKKKKKKTVWKWKANQ